MEVGDWRVRLRAEVGGWRVEDGDVAGDGDGESEGEGEGER